MACKENLRDIFILPGECSSRTTKGGRDLQCVRIDMARSSLYYTACFVRHMSWLRPRLMANEWTIDELMVSPSDLVS